MAKNAQQRINDTLLYIGNNVGVAEQAEVLAALPAAGTPAYNQISNNIRLGKHLFGNAQQRHALRALLLCHQAFITNAITRNTETAHVRQAHANTAPGNLLGHIRSWFTVAAANAIAVCAAASAQRALMPTWNNFSLQPRGLVRGVMPNYSFNCYNALVFWAFQGGCISLRWIWNTWVPATTNPLQAAALLPTPVVALPLLDPGGEHPVPQGHVVVMQRVANPLGHTVMSIGGGIAISQNNKAVLPGAANGEPTLAKQQHAAAAINDCNNSRCHEISIRFLVQEYYPAVQGYTPMHHPPFWLSYAAATR